MTLTRITGNVPLKRINTRWKKYYNQPKINPNLDPKHLSQILKNIGTDQKAQDTVFAQLINGDSYAYDLSAIFTRSTLNLAELGYNSQKRHVPQVNLVMLVSAKQHLPVMIRVVPGSVWDVSTIKTALAGLGLSNVTLILDRGMFSEENIQDIVGSQSGVVVAARRNSKFLKR
ncbi:MAG: transposase [Nitrososphaerota archaeon]|jgi:transposase|nr:transposase [Nitrososphaerota archaeon]